MHGLPILQQEVGTCAGEGDGDGLPGEGAACDAGGAGTGWGLGGVGPVLKTQTIVSVGIGMIRGGRGMMRSDAA